MNKIKPFNDFLSDLILEKIGQGELPIKLSKRLYSLLSEIDHEISEKLIEDDDNGTSSKFTLIDLDDKQIDMFTYATSPKIEEYVIKNTNTEDIEKNLKYYKGHAEVRSEMWSVNRSPIKIGKFINKLYPDTYVNAGKPGEDIESFVNAIKSEREKKDGNFKIVTGQDIVKYYDIKNYDKGSYSALHNSCMAYSHCSDFIEFYAKNNAELVVLMGDGDKIKGRAILWTITRMGGEKVDRKFMDRIYTIQSHDVSKFTNLAQQNDWLYKNNQDMYADTHIVDPMDGSSETRSMKIKGIKQHKAYPYMDTMKYFNLRDGFLTNDDDNAGSEYVVLESADGGYIDGDNGEFQYDEFSGEFVSEGDMVWLDNEERHMHIDHAIHSEYENEYASPEYAREHWKYSELEEDWIPEDDAIYISSRKQWVSENYAEQNLNLCDYDDEYYTPQESLDSDAYNYVPKKKAVFVITDKSMDLEDYLLLNTTNYNKYVGNEIDVRYKDDKSYFTVVVKNSRYYYLDLKFKGSDYVKQIKKGVI